jgi:3-methyladenine DNA glycosylase AlkC
MAEALKNMFDSNFFDDISNTLEKVVPGFNGNNFLEEIYDKDWKSRELKERMRHITLVLHRHLTADFKKNVSYLLQALRIISAKGIKQKLIEYMFLPDYIEVFGLDHYMISMDAMEEITQFTSCEFGVRPFLIKYPKKGIKQMFDWASHKHPMVRRLASEGCRPRLPWAMALPLYKVDPMPILPILEKLKDDVSESVRRSVANNLNDISKDNPEIVIDLVQKWKGKTKELDWVIKHACRGLLKQGNPAVLELFDFTPVEKLTIENVSIETPIVSIGESLSFSFELVNFNDFPAKIRLEYGLYFMKANGTLAKKVFTISEKNYEANSRTNIKRKQAFKIITTRKLYPGKHGLSIIINGREFEVFYFEFVE